MFAASLNYLAVLVAGISAMVIGAIWYGPLFGKKWMGLVGKTEEDLKNISPAKAYGVSFIAAIVTAYVLARFIGGLEVTSVAGGMLVALMGWLGLTMAASLPHYLFEDRSQSLFSINYGYSLVKMLAMGAILGVWH